MRLLTGYTKGVGQTHRKVQAEKSVLVNSQASNSRRTSGNWSINTAATSKSMFKTQIENFQLSYTLNFEVENLAHITLGQFKLNNLEVEDRASTINLNQSDCSMTTADF